MGPAPTIARVIAVASTLASITGTSSVGAATPTMVSSTNITAANGVL